MNSAVLRVLDLVPQCYSAEDGRTVRDALEPRLVRGERIVLSFTGVAVATSSFVNTALVPLLDLAGPSVLCEQLVLRDLRPAVAALLRQRLAFETQRHAESV